MENPGFLSEIHTQFALVPKCGTASDEFHAPATEKRVERIRGRYIDGPAGRVASFGSHFATLRFFTCVCVFALASRCHIVINELTECRQEDGNGVVVVT